MPKPIKRMQYYIQLIFYNEDGGGDIILTKEKKECMMEGYPIPEEIGEFIAKRTTCAKCRKKFKAPLKPCRCRQTYKKNYPGKKYSVIFAHLEKVNADDDIYLGDWRTLFDRERSRINSARRSELLNDNGKHTKMQIEDLFVAQKGSCYYCAKKISRIVKDPNKYHIDHFIPVSSGGSNDITNITLTCEKCNREKHNVDGNLFKRRAIRRLKKEENKERVRQIRKAVEKFRKTQYAKTKLTSNKT